MFAKNKLVVVISAIMSAGSAYAATLSQPTPYVVGFKPKFELAATDAISGKLAIDETITVDPTKLGFSDRDGDKLDATKSIFEWFSGDTSLGKGVSLKIPMEAGNNPIKLKATPMTETGDPKEGDVLIIANVAEHGATGGGTGGIVPPSETAKPLVEKVVMTANLAPGNKATATYEFLNKGGDPTDKSTYAWDVLGKAKAQVTNKTIEKSGLVPEFEITSALAGQVLELAIQAKNGKDIIGNTMVIDTTGKASTENGGSTEGSGGTENITGGENGKVDYTVVDPAKVTISFTSTATVADNGVEKGRPVASVDTLKVIVDPGKDGSTNLEDYTYKWFAGEDVIPNADKAELIPPANTQGKPIKVEVAPKQKTTKP